jgi:hypothetical protein
MNFPAITKIPSMLFILVVLGFSILISQKWFYGFDTACLTKLLVAALWQKGINVVCACDDAEYSLFTGQGGKQ